MQRRAFDRGFPARRVAWLAAAACVLPARSHGQPAPPRFAFTVQRAEHADTCPTLDTLAADVRRRLGRDPFDETSAQRLTVRFDTDAHGRMRGRLWLAPSQSVPAGPAGRTLLAQRPGVDCSTELLRSVGLAVALAIDPDLPPEPAHPAEPAQPPAPRCPEASPCNCPPAPAATVPVPSPVCPAPAPEAPRPPAYLPGEALLGAGIGLGTLPGVAAATTLTIRGLRTRIPVQWMVGALWSPTLATTDGRWAFGGFWARIGACAGGRVAGWFDPIGCAAIRVGAVHAAVLADEPVSPGDHWMIEAEASGALRAALRSGFTVEIAAGALVALARPSFRFEGSDVPIHSPWPVSLHLTLGAGFVWR